MLTAGCDTPCRTTGAGRGKKTMARARAGTRNYKCCSSYFFHQAKKVFDPRLGNFHAVQAKRTATCVDALGWHTPAANGTALVAR